MSGPLPLPICFVKCLIIADLLLLVFSEMIVAYNSIEKVTGANCSIIVIIIHGIITIILPDVT